LGEEKTTRERPRKRPGTKKTQKKLAKFQKNSKKVVGLMRTYFGGEFSEAAIRSNFVLVYELLDEVADHGWPQVRKSEGEIRSSCSFSSPPGFGGRKRRKRRRKKTHSFSFLRLLCLSLLPRRQQVTDANSLKALVFQKGFVTSAARIKREAAAAAATLQVTGAVGWRRDGLKYKRNEVFLDVTEKVSALVGVGGTVLRADVRLKVFSWFSRKGEVFRHPTEEKTHSSEKQKKTKKNRQVNGVVTMKAFLSGMPDVKLGLNDAVEDVTFHQCVNLGRYDAERVASFVPPDGEEGRRRCLSFCFFFFFLAGKIKNRNSRSRNFQKKKKKKTSGEFELMRYRCADAVALPFRLLPVVTEVGRTRLEVSLRLKATFDARLFATGVSVALPLPPTAAALDAVCSHGKAKYDPKKGALVWKIKRLAGGSEAALSGVVTCVATTRGGLSDAASGNAASGGSSSSRPPASLSFSVPMFSASGLRVQYLKVWEKSNYKVDKWVRKLCVSGDFSVRV